MISRKPADSSRSAPMPEIEGSRHDGLCYIPGNLGPSLLCHQLASHGLKVTSSKLSPVLTGLFRYIHEAWTLGPTLCRVFPFFFYGNVACSLMNMVAITVNRYVLITYHGRYNYIYSKTNIILMIFGVWMFSFGMILPPLLELWGTLGLDKATFSCTILK